MVGRGPADDAPEILRRRRNSWQAFGEVLKQGLRGKSGQEAKEGVGIQHDEQEGEENSSSDNPGAPGKSLPPCSFFEEHPTHKEKNTSQEDKAGAFGKNSTPQGSEEKQHGAESEAPF